MENSRRSRHRSNSRESRRRHSRRSSRSSSDSSYHRHSKHKHSHKHSHRHSHRHSRHDRDRDRDRHSTRSRHSRRSYSSDRYSDRHRSRSHRREKYSTASSTSRESQRYRFDSPPKTFLDYNQKIWDVYKTSANPEEFIDRVQQVASIVPSSQANKLDRELYIGNLPSGVTIPQLIELLNNAMINLGLNKYPGPPVLSAWISNDGHYAFVEFRSIEEAQAGYALNDSCILGQPLKVGKPKNYAGNQPATVSGLQALNMTAVGLNRISEEMASKLLGGKGRLMISGLPHGLVVDECKKILEEFGKVKCLDMPKDPITGLTKGYAVFDYEEDVSMAEALQQSKITVSGCIATISRVGKESLAQAFLPPTPDFDNRARFTSRILVLKNMVKITDLEIDEDYEDMLEDVMEECKEYGRVISIVIPRPGIHTSGIGKIFVEYPVVEEAQKAKIGLEGMRFNGNRVQCGFQPEELYFQSNFVGDD